MSFPAVTRGPQTDRLLQELRAAGHAAAVEELEKALREPWDARRVTADAALAGEWARHQGQAVVLNEFGVLAWKAPVVDRLYWLETVRRPPSRPVSVGRIGTAPTRSASCAASAKGNPGSGRAQGAARRVKVT